MESEPLSPFCGRFIEMYVLRVAQFTRHFGKSPEQVSNTELDGRSSLR